MRCLHPKEFRIAVVYVDAGGLPDVGNVKGVARRLSDGSDGATTDDLVINHGTGGPLCTSILLDPLASQHHVVVHHCICFKLSGHTISIASCSRRCRSTVPAPIVPPVPVAILESASRFGAVNVVGHLERS